MLSDLKRVHCIGIGGIHVSAVAKLLKARGVFVSGSDAVDSEQVAELRKAGFDITVGHAAENLGEGIDAVVYSHAVPEDNPELIEAKKRGIETYDTHAFLAKLFEGADQIVITGTHGKSTTTAMTGTALIAGEADPTVVVGTKVSSFPDGNLRIGSPELLVVEGDEYRRHVLEYEPKILVLNNIEYDHPDAFADMDAYLSMFRELIELVRDNGIIIYNADDEQCVSLIESKIDGIKERGIGIISVGSEKGVIRFSDAHVEEGVWVSRLKAMDSEYLEIRQSLPGEMNMRNATMAVTAAVAYKDDLDLGAVTEAMERFPGCWRRFERIGTFQGATLISDYGHHPTEVRETLKAARRTFPDARIVLCYQPHHRNRTKGLFNEFVTAFEDADVVLMSEIYDVPGREAAEDADVSSLAIVNAIKDHDPDRNIEFVGNLESTKAQLRDVVQEGDVLLMMGAGTIDQLARKIAE